MKARRSTSTETSIAEEIQQTRGFASRGEEATVALLRTASMLDHHLERLAQDHGITLQQYNVLRILRGEGGPLPIMTIGERLVQPTPGTSRLITRLEKQGLIERHHGSDDRRQVLIVITRLGRQRVAALTPAIEAFDEACLGTLAEECLQGLLTTLDRLRANIRQFSAETNAPAETARSRRR